MYTPSLLFGISASLDALLVGISYGLRGIRVRLRQNLAISLVTLLGTCLSVGLGNRLADFLPEEAGNCAGSMVLILLGLYTAVKAFLPLRRREVREAKRRSARLPVGPGCRLFCGPGLQPSGRRALPTRRDCRGRPPCLVPQEVLTLSLTLSLNNLSAGLSASLAGLALVPAAVASFVCSVLFLFSGNRLGAAPALQLAGRIADPLSGLLLIGLGLVQFLG